MSWEILIGLIGVLISIRLYWFNKYLKKYLIPYEIKIISNDKKNKFFDLRFTAVLGKGYLKRQYFNVIGTLQSEHQFTEEILRGLLTLTEIKTLLNPTTLNIVGYEILHHYTYFHPLQKGTTNHNGGKYTVKYEIVDPSSSFFKIPLAPETTAENYFKNGVAKINDQDFRGAIQDFTKVIDINCNHSISYSNRGIAKKELKDYNGAIADFTIALKIDPNYADGYSNRGSIKREFKDYRGALDDFNKAIEINSDHFSAHFNRGLIKLFNMSDFKGAIGDLTKAIEISPQANFYYNRGVAKFNLNDFKGSILDLTKAIEMNPNNGDVYFDRANAKRKLNDHNGAIADYTIAIEFNPHDADAYSSRGYAKASLEDIEGAKVDNIKALKIRPSHDGALKFIEFINKM